MQQGLQLGFELGNLWLCRSQTISTFFIVCFLFYFIVWRQHGDNALSTVEDTEVPQRIQRMFGKHFSISLLRYSVSQHGTFFRAFLCLKTGDWKPGGTR